MATINSTERPASEPELPAGTSLSDTPSRNGFSGRLLAVVVAVVAALTAGIFWLLGGTGGDQPGQPTQVVQDDGRGQQFGSADSLEHRAQTGTPYGNGSADSLEHHATPRAQ